MTRPSSKPDLANTELAGPDLAAPDLAAPNLAAPNLAAPKLAAPNLAGPEPPRSNPPGPNLPRASLPRADLSKTDLAKPGLAKTGRLSLHEPRLAEQWSCRDYPWRELFERADIVSEGAVTTTAAGVVYFGSSSVLLPIESLGGCIPDLELPRVRRAATGDPHARVRALRIAVREATVRARADLLTVHAELTTRSDRRGLRFDVDVEARIAVSRMTAS